MEVYVKLGIYFGIFVSWFFLSIFFYRIFFKRFYDILFSFIAIIILFPFIIVLTVIGIIVMKGNPFFIQKRPGKKEKVFNLIKFRTMTVERDSSGELLPDEKRLKKYGIFLRKTSLDELPELFNILIGNMSFIGPRPLLVKYLERYTEEQHKRHNVRPGLTGLAQSRGRNSLSWKEKFDLDVYYTENISLLTDLIILFYTALTVIKMDEISSGSSTTMEEFMGNGTHFSDDT
jgi:lipopolysaccharide/colanic/teichoic acid biosynthesis glycosyltransferase